MIVRQERVTAHLGEETEEDNDKDTTAHARGADHIHPGLLGVLHFNLDGGSNLCHLGLNKDGVSISFGVVLGQDSKSLIVAIFADKPTWAFRQEATSVSDCKAIFSFSNAYKTKVICRSEGQICSKDGTRQLQSPTMFVVRVAMAAAIMAPMKYEALNNEVKNGRSLGYPNSPIREEPATMANRMPTPSSIRAIMYMPTAKDLAWNRVRQDIVTYCAGQNPVEALQRP